MSIYNALYGRDGHGVGPNEPAVSIGVLGIETVSGLAIVHGETVVLHGLDVVGILLGVDTAHLDGEIVRRLASNFTLCGFRLRQQRRDIRLRP